ncbi:MAG TPA: hypothetical protein VMV72_18520 [Verrucomicrobiae bacterium]|nr:hypothetical protein [Verrucomicrobiae bacterium]
MSPENLRDLRVALLQNLYRHKPLGRRAAVLYQMVRQEVACDENDVAAQLAFLEGNHFICQVKSDQLAPGLPPFWFITTAGMVYCEENNLVP